MNSGQDPRINRFFFTPATVVGVVVIVIGSLVFLQKVLDFRFIHMAWKFWPLILVALGAAKWRESYVNQRSSTGGILLVGLGSFLLLTHFTNTDIEEIIAPMIMIAVGIAVVLFAIKQQRRVPPELQRSADFLQGTAILSGCKRRVLSQGFKGGELTAIFGGFELDLRGATMAGDSARIDVFVLFGGGVIHIPEHWEVVNHIMPLAGGVDDKTTRTWPEGTTRPRLVLTGQTLFGGLEIKD